MKDRINAYIVDFSNGSSGGVYWFRLDSKIEMLKFCEEAHSHENDVIVTLGIVEVSPYDMDDFTIAVEGNVIRHMIKSFN